MTLLGFGILGIGADPAEAQLLGRRRVTVQETVVSPTEVVAPPPIVVSPTRVKVRPNRVVIKERRGVIARVPAVVTSTPVVSKSRTVESPLVVEERVVSPDPGAEDREIRLEKLMESPIISQPR